MKAYRIEIEMVPGNNVGSLFVRAFTVETALKKARARLAKLKLDVAVHCVQEIPCAEIIP